MVLLNNSMVDIELFFYKNQSMTLDSTVKVHFDMMNLCLYNAIKKGVCMLNQVVLVGRLTQDVETRILDDGKKVSNIYLAVQRPFKNIEGQYDTDFVKCSVWEGLSTLIESYCQKGTMVALKGRIQSYKKEINESNITMMEVIAERISYLKDTKEDYQKKAKKDT